MNRINYSFIKSNESTMQLPNLEDFSATTRAMGYDAVSIRDWEPNKVIPTHTHEFGVHAIVTQGEMWLTRGGDVEHLQVGDTFTMLPDTPHSEKYGPQGAIYWAARQFPKA